MLRTRKWLESLGYSVGRAEFSGRVHTPRGPIYKKTDLFGADLVAKNDEELVFVQVKSNPGHLAAGMAQLEDHGPWPSFVDLWVVYWPPHRRLVDGPEIRSVASPPPSKDAE